MYKAHPHGSRPSLLRMWSGSVSLLEMRRIVLSLALLSTPAMAQDRYVFTLYRAAGAPPHFMGSFDTRGECEERRSGAMRDTEAATASARQILAQAQLSAPAGADNRVRALQAERNNLSSAIRGNRRERLMQERLTVVDRELEALVAAKEALRVAGSEVERLVAYEQALRESSICERR